jgi:hypothetical protein
LQILARIFSHAVPQLFSQEDYQVASHTSSFRQRSKRWENTCDASKGAAVGITEQTHYVASMGAAESRNKMVWVLWRIFFLITPKKTMRTLTVKTASDRDEWRFLLSIKQKDWSGQ